MLTRADNMKALFFALLVASTAEAQQSYVITDGKSLKDGLDIYLEFRAGTRRVTWEETMRAAEAATYTQAYAEACYAWQSTAPDKAPFRLPPERLNAEEFVKVVQKYLNDHSERLRDKAQILLFDAIKSAFPRK
ncbi:MAG TPA: Rap1a/Tai family immunity protein [Chthoniobacterales bacterium]|jgi:hypothetical protein|nr:Rap1a/Tai family immunity protein [Chthoniobacterales bacterium]